MFNFKQLYFSLLGNWRAQKPVKMTEIEKNKIQVLIKVRYNLSDHKVSDLNSNNPPGVGGAKLSLYA